MPRALRCPRGGGLFLGARYHYSPRLAPACKHVRMPRYAGNQHLPARTGREFSLNVWRRTVDLRRPEMPRNEGSTGPAPHIARSATSNGCGGIFF